MYHLILLSLFFLSGNCINYKQVECTKLEKEKKVERISLVLLIEPNYTKANKLFTIWDDLAEIFDDYVDFSFTEVCSKLPSSYASTKYPAVKVINKESSSVNSYTLPITVEDLVPYVLGLIEKSVKERFKAKGYVQRDSYVEELSEANFSSSILDSEDHYLIEFYAPWCGHCKALAPAWKEAAKRLYGKMKLAAVDATVHKNLASNFRIQGFPTIKFIPAHSKDLEKSATDYNGGRNADDIVKWAESKLVSLVPPPELVQLTSQKELDSGCLKKSICVIAFVPNRIDSSSTDWEKYISELKNVVNTFKNSNWGWFWAEGGVYEAVESKVGVGGFGYPALVAINYNKKAYSVMKSSYSTSNIKTFLNSLGTKSVVTEKLPDNIPEISETKKWDGKKFTGSEL